MKRSIIVLILISIVLIAIHYCCCIYRLHVPCLLFNSALEIGSRWLVPLMKEDEGGDGKCETISIEQRRSRAAGQRVNSGNNSSTATIIAELSIVHEVLATTATTKPPQHNAVCCQIDFTNC